LNWWQHRADGAPALAPSLLAADFAELKQQVRALEEAGADLFHLDIMDGHFVPNLTFGPFIVKAIRRCTERVLDAHLMISRPHEYLEAFARAGVEAITFHVEAESRIGPTLKAIGDLGLRRGLSLNPGTDLSELDEWLPQLDLVLVMSVQPGFGGQDFDPRALDKIRRLARLRNENGWKYAISVDGGVDARTAPDCREAGADILVSGTYFVRAQDRGAAAEALRG
jgi:ribulose-phosphate 3-epimerase